MSEKKLVLPEVPFEAFIERFPEVELPFTLATDTHFEIGKINQPLAEMMIQQYILPYETEERDEFTEYLPCCSIPYTEDFYGVIYWKASLLNYEYVLATYILRTGKFITKQTIGGTKVNGAILTHSVATIDEDWLIHVVEGSAKDEKVEIYDPTKSKTHTFELMDSGDIMSF